MFTAIKYTVLLLSFVIWAYSHADSPKIKVLKQDKESILLLVTQSYLVGESDSLSDIKKIIIENSKNAAAEYTGTYMESSVIANQDGIQSEYVKVLTATYQEVVSTDFDKSITSEGHLLLKGSITTKLSREAINEGIKRLKTDPTKQEAITKLQAENQVLRNKLSALLEKINQSIELGGSDFDASLLKERDATLSYLNTNQAKTKKLLASGELISLHKKRTAQLTTDIKELEKHFFSTIEDGTTIHIGEPVVKKVEANKYNVKVPLNWSVDINTDLLNPLFANYGMNTQLDDDRYWIYYPKQPHFADLFEALYSQVLSIELSIYGRVKSKRIIDPAYYRRGKRHFPISEPSYERHAVDRYNIIVFANHPSQQAFYSRKYIIKGFTKKSYDKGYKGTELIDFGLFSENELSAIHAIEAKIVRSKINFSSDNLMPQRE